MSNEEPIDPIVDDTPVPAHISREAKAVTLLKQHATYIAEVGEHTVFPEDTIRIGDWSDLPATWDSLIHVVRGPEDICGPSLIALELIDDDGSIYFPVPPCLAILLGATLLKGRKLAQAAMRKAINIK